MALSQAEFDVQFQQYFSQPRHEVHVLIDATAVLRSLRGSHEFHDEINLSLGFFHTLDAALQTKVVLWIAKLLDEEGREAFTTS